MTSDTVYIPQEDSFLLTKCVLKYVKGKTLDMGCGSGIQGINALKKVDDVTFSDINIKALEYVKTQIGSDSQSNIRFVHSDLFSNIKDKYDTIIFNPPYLPEDEFDDERLITTGGHQGHELIEMFLKEGKNHLNIDGQILLLFSSLSDKGKIDMIIRRLGYDKYQIAKESMFMEQLYVYQLNIRDKNIIKGHRGIVEIRGNVAIKRSLTKYYDATQEAKFLKLLNKKGIGPKFISNTKDELRMEYIKGDRIIDYMEKSDKKDIILIISKVLDQLYIMDTLKINKLEMTNPYKHIIVRKDRPIMIDFERCIYTEKPKNVTQFIQFLTSGKLTNILEQKKISVDKKRLFDVAKSYKDDMDKRYIKDIIKNIN